MLDRDQENWNAVDRGTASITMEPVGRFLPKQLENVGLDPEPTNPAFFDALNRADHVRWAKVVNDAGIRLK
jgi:hypothetical protein